MARASLRRGIALTAVPVLLVTACSGTKQAAQEAQAKDYPKKNVTWVVPYAAGGNTDSISRVTAEAMSKDLGQKVVVENKAGGSGAIGMQEIESSKADGYTIGMFTTGTMVVTPVVNKLKYNQDTFTNIGLLLTQPVVVLTKPGGKHATFADMVTAAKAAPGSIKVGVPGATTPQAYELQRMERDFGVKFTAVPFDSNAEVIKALMGGSVDAVALNASKDVQKQATGGDLKAVAVGEAKRLSWLPDTPTFVESGMQGLDDSGTLIGLTAPKDLPEGVRARLEKSLEKALQDPKVIELLGKDNISPTFVGTATLNEKLKNSRGTYEELAKK
ncbi:Bug family tripartite tricarboxylate transporter substrate binding protein [Mariniluteicoccus flavus]